jgi:hypothetical protein
VIGELLCVGLRIELVLLRRAPIPPSKLASPVFGSSWLAGTDADAEFTGRGSSLSLVAYADSLWSCTAVSASPSRIYRVAPTER